MSALGKLSASKTLTPIRPGCAGRRGGRHRPSSNCYVRSQTWAAVDNSASIELNTVGGPASPAAWTSDRRLRRPGVARGAICRVAGATIATLAIGLAAIATGAAGARAGDAGAWAAGAALATPLAEDAQPAGAALTTGGRAENAEARASVAALATVGEPAEHAVDCLDDRTARDGAATAAAGAALATFARAQEAEGVAAPACRTADVSYLIGAVSARPALGRT